MSRLRLTILLYDHRNGNSGQSTDQALIRKGLRTKAEIEEVALDLIERGQYMIRWDTGGILSRMLYDDLLAELEPTFSEDDVVAYLKNLATQHPPEECPQEEPSSTSDDPPADADQPEHSHP